MSLFILEVTNKDAQIFGTCNILVKNIILIISSLSKLTDMLSLDELQLFVAKIHPLTDQATLTVKKLIE